MGEVTKTDDSPVGDYVHMQKLAMLMFVPRASEVKLGGKKPLPRAETDRFNFHLLG